MNPAREMALELRVTYENGTYIGSWNFPGDVTPVKGSELTDQPS